MPLPKSVGRLQKSYTQGAPNTEATGATHLPDAAHVPSLHQSQPPCAVAPRQELHVEEVLHASDDALVDASVTRSVA